MRYLQTPFKLLLPVLLAFLLNATPGKAQNLLAFSPNVISGWPDTTNLGSIVPVGGYLKNFSPSDTFGFYDTLWFQGTVDTGSGPIPFLVQYPGQVFINPGDTQFIIFSFQFDTGSVGAPQFHVGNNVVVVWPIGVGPGSFDAGDSISLNVYIKDDNSIGNEPPGGFLRIYPIPANGPLVISSYHPQYHVTTVVIFDAIGNEVYNGIPNGQSIDTESWAPGIYFVQAGLSNGTVSWYKIMRQ